MLKSRIGTALYLFLRQMPPKNGGHFGGQRPPKEHIPPPIKVSLSLCKDDTHNRREATLFFSPCPRLTTSPLEATCSAQTLLYITQEVTLFLVMPPFCCSPRKKPRGWQIFHAVGLDPCGAKWGKKDQNKKSKASRIETSERLTVLTQCMHETVLREFYSRLK